jgi:hypothetical protein
MLGQDVGSEQTHDAVSFGRIILAGFAGSWIPGTEAGTVLSLVSLQSTVIATNDHDSSR